MLRIFVFAFVLSILLTITHSKIVSGQKQLKQVLIFSRHNLRTPIRGDLEKLTPKKWPKWDVKSGYLTQKGAILEGYLGEYFVEWLREENLLKTGCPTQEEVFIYSNVKERTIASATAFARKGFPDCDIKIHHKNEPDTDPVFSPVIRNGSESFKHRAFMDIVENLSHINLSDAYEKLNNILDVKHSNMCNNDKQCDLAKDVTVVKPIVVGKAPILKGPLKLSNSAVDSFLMEYYDGRSMENVAWGGIKNEEDLGKYVTVTKTYHNAIFNTTMIAKDISRPLVKSIRDIFKNKSGYPRFSLLMGHDANLLTLFKYMNFVSRDLPNQIESTPVGSKIVFQKWLDSISNIYYLRINFVYLSPSQIRKGDKISDDNPPQFVLMELKDCKVDESGFCQWDDFVALLDRLSKN